MFAINDVNKYMNENKFSESIRSMDGKYVSSITYTTMRLDGTDFSCTVDLEKEEFTFSYCVPHSINLLKCGPCGSLYNQGHFYKLYRKFLKHVRALYWEEQEV